MGQRYLGRCPADVSQNPLGEGEGRTDQAYRHMQRP